jgi:glycosyltransferase involved in cell wall biosynthesis
MLGAAPAIPRLLHVLPGFAPGGMEMLVVSLINATGERFSHSILAIDGNYEAASRIRFESGVRLLDPPPRTGQLRYPFALRALARRESPNLIATYNWGATDMILGTLWGVRCGIVHNEHGFGRDEAQELKWRRVWARRLMLARVDATIVISRRLFRVAMDQYRLPRDKVIYIRNGIDTCRFQPGWNESLRRELGIPAGAMVIGYTGAFRPEKNVALLVRAFARAAIPESRLLLVGDGPERPELESLTAALALGSRVIFAGTVADTAPYYRVFDLFALSSLTEQTPMSLLEAMASGLACLTTDVGDCAAILDPATPPFLVPPDDEWLYTESLRELAAGGELRRQAGLRNLERARADYDFAGMVAAYERVWRNTAKAPL